MAKKLSKTGKKLMGTSRDKVQLYREYMRGYMDGENYLSTCVSSDEFTPTRAEGMPDGFWDGFVDGYNDNLENMRIE